MNVLGLVQLCEAAQPAGGYSHSFGIEKMVRTGRLSSPDQVAALVRQVLVAAIGPADGVASGIAFRAARHGDFEALPQICTTLSSDRLPVAMRLASLQMGQRLWGLSSGWEWASGVHQQLDPLAQRRDLHHAVAFGALVSETTSSQMRAIASYLFNTARNLIQAAVRAIPLDDITGQRVLSSMQPTITELASACADKQTGDIAAYRSDDGGGGEALPGLFP